MTSSLFHRTCDGQPTSECQNDSDVERHLFNSAALDSAMNYPLRPPVVNEFAELAEPEHNEPWSWVDDLRDLFWLGVFLAIVAAFTGLALATVWNLYRSGTFSLF